MELQATLKTSRRQDRLIDVRTQEDVQHPFGLMTSKRDRALFRIAYRHGLRASEVGLLSRSDADLWRGRQVTANKTNLSYSQALDRDALT